MGQESYMLASITRQPNIRTKGGMFIPIHADAATHGLINVAYYDHELHRGHIFTHVSYEEIAAGGDKSFYIEVPATPTDAEYFFRWRIHAVEDWSFHFHADPVFSGAGATEGVVPTNPGVSNKRIGSTNVNDLIFKEDANIGATGSEGTLVAGHYVPGTGGASQSSGVVEGDPVIVPAGLRALLVCHNENVGSASYIDWTFEWWEQTPKTEEV